MTVEQIIAKCNHHPRITGDGWEFEWAREQGHFIYPGISRQETKDLKTFLDSAVSFLNEGTSAQMALNKMAKKQGLSLSKRTLRTRELVMEPIVIFVSHTRSESSDSEYSMMMIDQEFFVDRTTGVADSPSYGVQLKWELGNLRIKDRTGVFQPIIPPPRVERERLARLRHFRDEISKVLEDEDMKA